MTFLLVFLRRRPSRAGRLATSLRLGLLLAGLGATPAWSEDATVATPVPAVAPEPAPAAANPTQTPSPSTAPPPASCAFGPWALGMSRDEIRALVEAGPYTDVPETGGFETRNARAFGAANANVSFVFGESGLNYMMLFHYEGKDYKAAKAALLALFDEFQANYGGAVLEDFKVEGPQGAAALDHQVLADLLEQVLGEAKAVGERALRDQNASVSMMFDLEPLQQPCANRVHVQWGYHSKHDTYYVLVFQDRHDAPLRSIDRNFRLGPP